MLLSIKLAIIAYFRAVYRKNSTSNDIFNLKNKFAIYLVTTVDKGA